MATSQHTTRIPNFRLYQVTGEGDQAHWTPIGAAWMHRDGKGFGITCDAFPLQGRIVARVNTPRTTGTAAGGQQ